MKFKNLLKLIENQNIEPTRVMNAPVVKTPIKQEIPKEEKQKLKIAPINDFLLKLRVGQDAYVDMPGNESGWIVETKGQKYIRLKKNPSDNSVGGNLVVPNQIYMNWQLKKQTLNKQTNLGFNREKIEEI